MIYASRKEAFTLIELLLSVSLIALMAAISVPVYQSFQVGNDLDVAVNTIAQSLRRAAALSQASDGDISWGLFIESGRITLFKGLSYLSRDPNFDEVFDLATSITPSGLSEIVFSKFSGDPQVVGDITLTTADEFRTISINSKGAVLY